MISLVFCCAFRSERFFSAVFTRYSSSNASYFIGALLISIYFMVISMNLSRVAPRH